MLRGLRTRVGAGLLGLLIGAFALTPHAQDDVRRGATTGITGLSGCGASTTVVLGSATCSANVPAATIVGSGGQTLDLSAADVTTLSRTTNPQAFLIYQTLTDASNYGRASLDFTTTSNRLSLVTTAAGSGTARDIQIRAGGNNLWLGSAGGLQWQIDGSGSLLGAIGVITTSHPIISGTATLNAAGVAFIGTSYTFTETASAAGTRYFQILGGASGTTDEFYVQKGGTVGVVNLTITAIPASSGTRYLCISTTGVVSSSASACSGT